MVAAFHVQPENALLSVGVRASWASAALYRSWVRSIYNRVDEVVSPTDFAAGLLRDHGVTVPITVVSNGISPDVRPLEAVPARASGQFLILMVGRFAPEKRQEVLLEAVRRSRHRDRIKVVLAGSGPRAELLAALARDLPNSPEVGFLPRARLVEVFNTADLFVHTSEVELEGMAVLEAMSVGLPALIAQSPHSAASAFALSDALRFPRGDVSVLAERLDHWIAHPELWARARREARAFAQRFSFTAGVEALGAVYRRAVLRGEIDKLAASGGYFTGVALRAALPSLT